MSDDPDKLRVGDVVRVKNIVGPRMLLSGFDGKNPGNGMACLKWFNRHYEMCSEWFHVRHLAKFNPHKDRPISYRVALAMIREAVTNLEPIIMPDGMPLVTFIDSIIYPEQEPEAADAAD